MANVVVSRHSREYENLVIQEMPALPQTPHPHIQQGQLLLQQTADMEVRRRLYWKNTCFFSECLPDFLSISSHLKSSGPRP